MAIGVQVSQGGTGADAVGVIHGNRSGARGVWVVHIWVFGETFCHGCLVEGFIHRHKLCPGKSPYRDGTVGAVKIVFHVKVGLQFAKEGQ